MQKHLDQVKILVVNGGSSSLKFQLIDLHSKNVYIKGVVDAINILDRCNIKYTINGETITKNANAKNHDEAVVLMINELLHNDIIGDISEINAVGHRVVHGAEIYTEPVLIDYTVIDKLKEISNLAPLHNPANISCIEAAMGVFNCPHVAVFDTAFHSTIAPEKFMYALPYEYYEKYKIRKYGFHGSSHKYISNLLSDYYKLSNKKSSKIITCHLGNGCSIAAIKNGKSINTTMGFTPLDGLMMGTRSGSIDPAIIPYLESNYNMQGEQIRKILNSQSGLLGISGHSDMRDIYESKEEPKSKLAMDMFADRLTHYIGAYIAELGGVDGIAFTGGIGENAHYIRKKVLENFDYIGLKLDNKKNEKNEFIISNKDSKVTVFVLETNEELQIAMDTKKLLKLQD
ncbi:MAG TPA: acetate kinase [Alphaproteobacteria bacterium]|nr:acetate kinase [Alphaproteobacteria bacterium]